MSASAKGNVPLAVPFDAGKLDHLLEEMDVDVLLVTSKHNLSYMLGGYRFFFFEAMDAIGTSRYLPVLVYFPGHLESISYVANVMEAYEKELGRFWVPNVHTTTWTTLDAMGEVIGLISRVCGTPKKIGIETAFLPADAYKMLEAKFGETAIVDAHVPLERLRARKSKTELDYLREASERVVASMLAVISSHGPGTTKRQLAEAMRRAEIERGLNFEYCLVTAGTSLNRAPSEQPWREGEIASLDSGGNYRGYIGDLCRMAILGEPDQELQDFLGEIDEIQQAARKPIRPGAIGSDIFAAAERLRAKSRNRQHMSFVAHGMGLISHEAPRLTSKGPVPYLGVDADLPLEEGMVISIETTLSHPGRGFIKLEDTVAVTAMGCDAYGDEGRGWNRGNTV
jgi:Xaa-Pro aminopeptidase